MTEGGEDDRKKKDKGMSRMTEGGEDSGSVHEERRECEMIEREDGYLWNLIKLKY